MRYEIAGGAVEIDESDLPLVSQYKWHVAKRHSGIRYARSCFKQQGQSRTLYMHRLILGLPEGRRFMADHVDGNGLNNTRHNLRRVSSRQNSGNRAAPGFGTQKAPYGYMSRIYVNKRPIYLGHFKTRGDGERAYIEASLKHHGNYSVFMRPEWQEDSRVREAKKQISRKEVRRAELLWELKDLGMSEAELVRALEELRKQA